jgi:RNA-directed DNA polymerase
LELNPRKTRITHTLRPLDGTVGFDFLGFNVRQYAVGKTHSARTTNGRLLGFKTLIKPSTTAQHRHYAQIAALIERHGQAPQGALIRQLNPRLIGWANYYSTVVAAHVFGRLDTLVYRKLKRWAERRHPGKGHGWVARHYWRPQDTRKWVFRPASGPALARYRDVPIRRHVKVRGAASPFDGNWAYWASRMARHPQLSRSKAVLLKRQQGKCAWCGQWFIRQDELLEVDHVLPRSLGGGHGLTNRMLVHRHCHDQKTARDGSHPSRP